MTTMTRNRYGIVGNPRKTEQHIITTSSPDDPAYRIERFKNPWDTRWSNWFMTVDHGYGYSPTGPNNGFKTVNDALEYINNR